MKIQATDWEKIFIMHISDIGHFPRLHKAQLSGKTLAN